MYGQQVVIHRADLHNALIEHALAQETVQLRENSPVLDVCFEPASPSVTLANGTVIRADVVLAVDGIKSTIRERLLNDSSVKAEPTGDAAYRIMLPRAVMQSDPELRELVDEPQATRWLGPNRHVIAYPVRGHELYNVVLVHPDRHGVQESWTTRGSKQSMIENYRGWDRRVTKLIDLVRDDEVLEWKLCLHSPLRTWVRGSVALLGDACHPMLLVPSPSSFLLYNTYSFMLDKKQSLHSPRRRPGRRRRQRPGRPALNPNLTHPNPPGPSNIPRDTQTSRRNRPAIRHPEPRHAALCRWAGAEGARRAVPGVNEAGQRDRESG